MRNSKITNHSFVAAPKAGSHPLYLLQTALYRCLGPALFSVSLGISAQTPTDLRFLIFDPVPIERVTPQAGDPQAETSSIVTELASPPSENAVSLQTWLAANTGSEQLNQEQLLQTISNYEESVRDLELDDGPFSAALPQQLLALGTSYEQSGDLDKALEYYDRASHITRINQGLFSTEQIPIIERIINNYLRRGDLQAADDQQRYLFFLQQKNYGLDSAELLPALNNFAEWNMFAFSAPPSGSFGQSLNDARSNSNNPTVIRSAEEANFRVARLINAQNLYWSIIQILLDNFGDQDPRLLDFEKRLALTNYFFATTVAAEADALSFSSVDMNPAVTTSKFSPPSISNMGYRHGRDALERRRNYMLEMPNVATSELTKAGLDLADWMLIFNRQRVRALEMYQELHDSLNPDDSVEELNGIFTPAFPVPLPSFIFPLNSRAALGIPAEQALEYQGYVDIELRLNRFGKTTAVEILETSEGTPENLAGLLVRNLRRTQFRPRFENGKLRDSDIIQTRFYYAY